MSDRQVALMEEKKPLTRIFMRPGVIEEEPDSLDSVIGNLPLTIVPSLARISTHGSGFSRQESVRSRAFRPGTTRKYRKRAILKSGECNITTSKVSQQHIRFLQDIFTTLVDAQWRWTLMVFAFSFIGSWLFFAVIWWLIAFTHGDLEELHLPGNQDEVGWTPCVFNIKSFTSCFLFSIETQHTIGYGVRTTTEECPEAIFIMCFQSIYGVMIQAFMVGIVFAKMTRPKHRTQTLLFSKNAVICQRDGELCFMFRVGDMRKSHIIGASIRAQLIRTRTTKEGEVLAQYQSELDVGADGSTGDLFFIWPQVVVHRINSDSPLYNMSASDLLQDRFEIVVILEGTVESTGQSTQARSSYVNSEILWGHRFEPMVFYNKESQGYEINYSKFDETQQVDTPLCSSRELAEFYKIQDEFRSNDNILDHVSSKTLLEKRWNFKYRSLMDTISQYNLEDETGSLRLGRHPSNRTYLTIQGVPRRQRSYQQLESNLRNLFDTPSPSPPPPPPPPAVKRSPSVTPPPTIDEGVCDIESSTQQNPNDARRDAFNSS
ncbi:G protein-activated inward rectifier potassium channel 3 isoform X2 [Toxorhynchites rutilus septentrionalis]|uniref:G protein-activated inward rectifier potassium channel 3 isoform X2 n=1 Tax=Toxorhynchites rutilus septentrionalis TaxID=329112 RepID=UPI002479DFFB|nr:G protein-activated inward rectifier potassium channel 3 isoform X2 [Toxorhynchites rutilus septentrionalis]